MSNSSTKFRIVLRVGDGEPTFEVRSGDDLVLKVVSDKVDVKSPEKGSGPSTVKASGKVHFVGFGAEGNCDELAFLAGTGEVNLTGNVKVHVKDKLGRIESELSTERLMYKIDASAIGGSLKP
jgi:lipopolysaccharide export system protein LptA